MVAHKRGGGRGGEENLKVFRKNNRSLVEEKGLSIADDDLSSSAAKEKEKLSALEKKPPK